VLVLIQARMNSKRFPKKVLFKIYNKEILSHIISRIKKCCNNVNIVVATSKKKFDLPIIKLCKREKIKYFRGELEDVANRLLCAAKKFKSKHFIRICGDSPLIDPVIIDKLINISKKKKQFDLISNRHDKSTPSGQTVEIIKTKSLEKAYESFFLKKHYEHVTSFFYENKKNFLIFNTSLFKKKSNLNLTVDNKNDLKKIRVLFKKMKNKKYFGIKQIEKV